MSKKFFREARKQSIVKATIISKYFWAWAKVVIPSAQKESNKIAYIDLFAGPGRFENGAKSTPLLILETAIQEAEIRNMLVTLFNDTNSDHSCSLEEAINALPGIETLRHRPQVVNYEVGDELVKQFEEMNFVPTLFFVDPWGYKGLSLRLVNSVLKNWGCDCIFFFNYNRINMGLPNDAVDPHLNALFGEGRATELRRRLIPLTPNEREQVIVEELAQALKEMGGEYVLPFRFKNGKGTRTSHHLIFVSKHFKGYEIMKGIMARESSTASQGVPSLEYSPAGTRQSSLFELSRPLDDLRCSLLDHFASRTLTMQQVYEEHNVDKPYIKKNYKDILRRLEAEGKITADPPATRRRLYKGEVSFGDKVEVSFPAKKG